MPTCKYAIKKCRGDDALHHTVAFSGQLRSIRLGEKYNYAGLCVLMVDAMNCLHFNDLPIIADAMQKFDICCIANAAEVEFVSIE